MADKKNINNMDDSIIAYIADITSNEQNKVNEHKTSTPLYCHYEENKCIVDAIMAINDEINKDKNYDIIYTNFIDVEKIIPHFTLRASNLVKVYNTINVKIDYKTRWSQKHSDQVKLMSELIESNFDEFIKEFESFKMFALACLAVENQLLEKIAEQVGDIVR